MGNGVTQQEALANVKKLKAKILASCSICNGLGYVEETQLECECADNFRMKSLPVLARVPESYQNYTLDTYPGVDAKEIDEKEQVVVDKIKNAIQSYIDALHRKEEKKGMIFTGKEGGGKTFAATYCMRHCMAA